MREDEFQQDENIEVPLDPIIEDMRDIIMLYTKAAQCAIISEQWYQLENILRSFWNLLIYHMASPIEFDRSGIYKDLFMLADQLLQRLDQFNKIKSESHQSAFDHVTDEDMKFYCNFIAFSVQ